MKIMKKLAVVLLAVMMVCPCFANVAFAAEGVAYFTDLETKVGDEFTVTGTVVARNDVIGDVTITLTYDTSYMQFISGDSGVKNSSGTITFTGSGNGSSDRVEFDMTFQALAEGDTQMDQTSAKVTTNSGATVNCTMGYSAITIGKGDPSKIKNLDENKDEEKSDNSTEANTEQKKDPLVIGDVKYKLSQKFSDTEIPVGFSKAEVTYNEKTYKGISMEGTDVNAVFAKNSEGFGKFFIINSATGDLYPMEEFIISDEYSIFILDGTEEMKLPEEYVEASIAINEVDYPVWIAPEREGFYVFYAINNMGEKSLYLYDSVEHTYQRMEAPITADTEDEDVSTLDKVLAIAEQNLIWIIVGSACAIIVLFILAIVLTVKLRHRNIELDDLYDEYGIDMDEDTAVKKKSNNKGKSSKKEEKNYYESDEFEDDYDDDYEYEDEYDDDEYEYEDEYDDDYDYYEEDDLADLRRDFGGAQKQEVSNANYDDYYDDDDFEEDDDYDYYPTKSNTRLSSDDTFEMNFIDLE